MPTNRHTPIPSDFWPVSLCFGLPPGDPEGGGGGARPPMQKTSRSIHYTSLEQIQPEIDFWCNLHSFSTLSPPQDSRGPPWAPRCRKFIPLVHITAGPTSKDCLSPQPGP